jgi:hypothetical protein
MIHIAAFFRRLLYLRKPEKTGEGVPLEKQEIPEAKEKEKGVEARTLKKGKGHQRKRRKPKGKGKTKKGRSR